MARETKTYILRQGHIHHGFDKDGNRHTFSGDDSKNNKVELTENQYKAFADKFDDQAELRQRLKDDSEKVDNEPTAKKPDPQPSVGTAEPTPKDVTPAPVGSTSDPVNTPSTSPAASAAGKK